LITFCKINLFHLLNSLFSHQNLKVMKKIILAILFIPSVFSAQLTRIEDSNFEQQLINLGYDDVLDGGVITVDIASVQQLNISNSNISDLTGIEDFMSLKSLNCMNNDLTSLPINQNVNLESLNCFGNYLNSLDMSQIPLLMSLNCGNNILLSLDVTANSNLEELYCSNNNLYSLDVSANYNLEILHCNNNVITNLNLSNNTLLIDLQCEENLLLDLDVSTNLYLENISCALNLIQNFNLVSNVNLNNLNCSGNSIISLDFSSNTFLEILDCSSNRLKQLNVSLNSNLRALNCSSNGLKCLNVKNGNNSNFILFNAVSNKELECLDVDDQFYAITNWSNNVDPGVVFSTHCGTTCSGSLTDLLSKEDEFSIYPNPAHGLINISTKTNKAFTVNLIDCSGRLLLTTNDRQIDLSGLAVGTYYLKLIIGSQVHISKIIKN